MRNIGNKSNKKTVAKLNYNDFWAKAEELGIDEDSKAADLVAKCTYTEKDKKVKDLNEENLEELLKMMYSKMSLNKFIFLLRIYNIHNGKYYKRIYSFIRYKILEIINTLDVDIPNIHKKNITYEYCLQFFEKINIELKINEEFKQYFNENEIEKNGLKTNDEQNRMIVAYLSIMTFNEFQKKEEIPELLVIERAFVNYYFRFNKNVYPYKFANSYLAERLLLKSSDESLYATHYLYDGYIERLDEYEKAMISFKDTNQKILLDMENYKAKIMYLVKEIDELRFIIKEKDNQKELMTEEIHELKNKIDYETNKINQGYMIEKKRLYDDLYKNIMFDMEELGSGIEVLNDENKEIIKILYNQAIENIERKLGGK